MENKLVVLENSIVESIQSVDDFRSSAKIELGSEFTFHKLVMDELNGKDRAKFTFKDLNNKPVRFSHYDIKGFTFEGKEFKDYYDSIPEDNEENLVVALAYKFKVLSVKHQLRDGSFADELFQDNVNEPRYMYKLYMHKGYSTYETEAKPYWDKGISVPFDISERCRQTPLSSKNHIGKHLKQFEIDVPLVYNTVDNSQ